MENPKYKQIEEDIKQKIESGVYKVNEKIMSESEICKKYEVSRITAVRSINDLVAEGYLIRKKGKGSFVKGKVIKEGESTLMGFSERMQLQNLKVTSKVLEKRLVHAPKEMIDFFNLPKDTEVIFLKRLRIVDDVPLCITFAYLMKDVYNWTLEENFENSSLYDLMENKYHFKLGKGTQLIKVDYLKKSDCKLLKVKEGSPCLKLSLFTSLDDGRVAAYDETYYAEDRYEYMIKLNR